MGARSTNNVVSKELILFLLFSPPQNNYKTHLKTHLLALAFPISFTVLAAHSTNTALEHSAQQWSLRVPYLQFRALVSHLSVHRRSFTWNCSPLAIPSAHSRTQALLSCSSQLQRKGRNPPRTSWQTTALCFPLPTCKRSQTQ